MSKLQKLEKMLKDIPEGQRKIIYNLVFHNDYNVVIKKRKTTDFHPVAYIKGEDFKYSSWFEVYSEEGHQIVGLKPWKERKKEIEYYPLIVDAVEQRYKIPEGYMIVWREEQYSCDIIEGKEYLSKNAIVYYNPKR